MAQTFVSLTTLAIHQKAVRALLTPDYHIDDESNISDHGTVLAVFSLHDCSPAPDFEALLIEKEIPYSIRVEPSIENEGGHEHFRIMSDGTHVSTGYTDSMQARMVTLEELIVARQQGIRAIDDLIRKKHNEHPVISWSDQFEVMMLPAL